MRVYVWSEALPQRCLVEGEDVASVLAGFAAVAGLSHEEAALLRLSGPCRPLDAALSLAEQGVVEESTLYADCALAGGKKRAKKVFTKPKKGHHKKKKFRLAILRCYKVDASGTVSRLRKECPNASCGPGVFMAKHENRTYCGRCGLTYMLVQQ